MSVTTRLVEGRVYAPASTLASTWKRVRELSLAHPRLFGDCEVSVAGPRPDLDALLREVPGLERHRAVLYAKGGDALHVAEALSTRRTRASVELGMVFSGYSTSYDAITARPPGKPALVAARIAGELWLSATIPWDEASNPPGPDPALVGALQSLGPSRSSRLVFRPASHRRGAGGAALEFPNENEADSTVRSASTTFAKAIATRAYARNSTLSEPRQAVFEKTTQRGNILRVVLDLGGLPTGPWSPAVSLEVLGAGGLRTFEVARQAAVSRDPTYRERVQACVEWIDRFEREHLETVEAEIGDSPAWLADLRPDAVRPS